LAEEWRVIEEFPDYAVSSLGRVKRIKPDRYGRMLADIILPIIGRNGYHFVNLHKDAKQHVKALHRIVCETFHGSAPSPKHHAAHNNGIPLDNRACNLRWATPSENSRDKIAHGTMRRGDKHHARAKPECMPRGIKHGNAKLNDAAVVAIRADTRPQKAIAESYGVAQSLISLVKTGKIWAHVTQQE
jgi:hypothetical protein